MIVGDVKTDTPINRRNFIKGISVATAVGVGAAALPKAARAARTKPHYGMLIDLRRCIGCHACSVDCKAEFAVPIGKTRSWVVYV